MFSQEIWPRAQVSTAFQLAKQSLHCQPARNRSCQMALSKISTLRCFILFDILLLMPDCLLEAMVSGTIIKSLCWKGSPMPIYWFIHITASSSKPTARQRDSSVFWVADVMVTSHTQRSLERVFWSAPRHTILSLLSHSGGCSVMQRNHCPWISS